MSLRAGQLCRCVGPWLRHFEKCAAAQRPGYMATGNTVQASSSEELSSSLNKTRNEQIHSEVDKANHKA
eukprot:3247442-Amphidinium_carterae.1